MIPVMNRAGKLLLASPGKILKKMCIRDRGRDLHTGLPKNIRISSTEICDAIRDPVNAIVAAIKTVLEETPPELLSDIIDEGITLTGAGALLGGLDKLIQLETGMATTVAENPLECTVAGLGRCLSLIHI